jgi:LPXTG-motif cell wall-anchored protein
MKYPLKTVLGAAAVTSLALVAAPMSAAAQVPDPLPDESIAEVAVAAELDTLVAAVTAAGLADGLGDCGADPFTVFAPTEAAFAAVPEDLLTAALGDPDGLLTTILTYHVVPGIQDAATVTAATSLTTAQGADIAVEGTVLNGSVNIVGTDNFACNGVVHLIDAVLLPPLPSIAELAVSSELDTLVEAVTAAGLADSLSDCAADPVTVFAPTDAAFAALPADTLAAALADPDGLLTTVLTYHVVPGLVGAAEVTAATSLTTAQGEAIAVNGAVLNGSVNIVATDNWACNGVVHVIDGVLLPPSLAPAAPTTTPTTAPLATTPAGDLPATGSENTVMALVAGLLVLGGIAMLGLRRRSTV